MSRATMHLALSAASPTRPDTSCPWPAPSTQPGCSTRPRHSSASTTTSCRPLPSPRRRGRAGSCSSRTSRASAPRTCRTRPVHCTGSGSRPPPARTSPGRSSKGCCAVRPTGCRRSSTRVSRRSARCSSVARRSPRPSARSPRASSVSLSSSRRPASTWPSAPRVRPPGSSVEPPSLPHGSGRTRNTTKASSTQRLAPATPRRAARTSEESEGTLMQKLRIGTGAVTAEIWTLGAALNAVWAPDREGNVAQVVLGHADEAERLASTAYLGEIVGPFSNRIRDARFSIFRVSHQLERNFLGKHSLHSGSAGFHRQEWTVKESDADHVRLTLTWSDTTGPGERQPYVVGVGLFHRPLLTVEASGTGMQRVLAQEVALQLVADAKDAEAGVADAVAERAHDLAEVCRRREPLGLVRVTQHDLCNVALAIRRPDGVERSAQRPDLSSDGAGADPQLLHEGPFRLFRGTSRAPGRSGREPLCRGCLRSVPRSSGPMWEARPLRRGPRRPDARRRGPRTRRAAGRRQGHRGCTARSRGRPGTSPRHRRAARASPRDPGRRAAAARRPDRTAALRRTP